MPFITPPCPLLTQARLKKRILLCVSGSIAAYKALHLISQLHTLGAKVAVVMSEGAKQFITPLSLEALSHHRVLHIGSEDWAMDMSKDSALLDISAHTPHTQETNASNHVLNSPHACNHIAYARWADIALVAPASANTIAKISCGIADSLISQTLLATRAPLLLAPSMNTAMLQAPQTKEHLARLQSQGAHIISSQTSRLACGIIGDGAMADSDEILFSLLKTSKEQDDMRACEFWRDKDVLITGGGSYACIDSVRALSNHSSGLQASALALALYTLGAKVTLITSSIPSSLPRAITIIPVKHNDEYHNAITQHIANAKGSLPILFMAAALADFAPTSCAPKKIKKSTTPSLTLNLSPTQDILASLDSRTIIKVGFKAEDNLMDGLAQARAMLLPREQGGKDCAIVCLNTLDSNPFGATHNRFTLLDSRSITAEHAYTTLPTLSKLEASYMIADFVAHALQDTSH